MTLLGTPGPLQNNRNQEDAQEAPHHSSTKHNTGLVSYMAIRAASCRPAPPPRRHTTCSPSGLLGANANHARRRHTRRDALDLAVVIVAVVVAVVVMMTVVVVVALQTGVAQVAVVHHQPHPGRDTQ